MQIFSSDILYQVNGQERRQQQPKKILRTREQFSGSNSTNEQRLNHIAEQMSNIEEKMLFINADSIHPISSTIDGATNGRNSVTQHTISTIKSQQHDLLPSIVTSATLPRDSLRPPKQKLTSLQGQRLQPQAQTFGEYMSNGSIPHSRNAHHMSSGGPSVSATIPHSMKQNNLSEMPPTSMVIMSNGLLSNSSSMIGKPLSRYSG